MRTAAAALLLLCCGAALASAKTTFRANLNAAALASQNAGASIDAKARGTLTVDISDPATIKFTLTLRSSGVTNIAVDVGLSATASAVGSVGAVLPAVTTTSLIAANAAVGANAGAVAGASYEIEQITITGTVAAGVGTPGATLVTALTTSTSAQLRNLLFVTVSGSASAGATVGKLAGGLLR